MKKLLTIGLMIATTASFASLRLGVVSGSADGVWVGDDETDFGSGKRTIKLITLDKTISMKNNSVIGFNLTHATTELEDGDFSPAGATEGDTRSGIAEVGFYYLKRLAIRMPLNLDVGAGFRAPGDYDEPSSFVALSDGVPKYDLMANLSYNLKAWNFALMNTYTLRGDRAENQMKNDLRVGWNHNKFGVYAMYTLFNTEGGADILDAEFTAAGNTTGFQIVDEDYNAISLGAMYNINRKYAVDVFVSKKEDGKNTDTNEAVGVGFTCNM